MENENEVKLVAGIINAQQRMLYWRDSLGLKIGDYAIVENANGYDLIKVVGIVHTNKADVKKFSCTQYENMKSTLNIIHISKEK